MKLYFNVSKVQLIWKCPFGFFSNRTKSQQNFNKRSNQKCSLGESKKNPISGIKGPYFFDFLEPRAEILAKILLAFLSIRRTKRTFRN